MPLVERRVQFIVKHLRRYLKELICDQPSLKHLLSLHVPFAHDLVGRKFGNCRGNGFSNAVAIPEFENEADSCSHIEKLQRKLIDNYMRESHPPQLVMKPLNA